MAFQGIPRDRAGVDLTGMDSDDLVKVGEYAAFLKEKKRLLAGVPCIGQKAVKSILIVDDDQEICELLHTFLEAYSYKVHLAFNGRMALEMYRNLSPDIVFLDLKMPDMDGVEVLKVMHMHHDTPTVIITGHPEFVSEVRASGAWVRGYLEKPLCLEKILSTLTRILGANDNGEKKA